MPYLTNRNNILEAIREHPERCRKLWIESGHERAFDEIINEARKEGISFRVLPREAFSRQFKDLRSHICLERDDVIYDEPESLLKRMAGAKDLLICAFDGVYDPQNLGSIIRTAAGLGIEAVIIPKDRACSVTETVVAVSRGGIEHVKVIRVTNLVRFLEELKKTGVFCYGFDEKAANFLWNTDLRGPVCLVFGSEEGMRRLTRERCDVLVRIPTSDSFPSLNVSTSFAVAAYEALRQRAEGKTRNEG